MISDPGYSDTGSSDGGSDPFASFNINQALQSGVQAFGIFEGAQTARAATSKLTSSSLTYVILGLGALGIVALFVFKH